MPVQGLFTDNRGNIIFTDTPGIFDKAKDEMSKHVNRQTLESLNKEADVVLYFVDPSRRRDFEEARVLGLARKINVPVILVLNKADLNTKYLPQYTFLLDEFKENIQISALKGHNLKPLLNMIFNHLKEKSEESTIPENKVYPLLNMDSKTFIAELIREKVFLMMGEEIPYSTTALVDKIQEKKNEILYIKARILTTNERHKRMLIGQNARKIKEIGSYARKEIALSTNKKVFLDLTVERDPHWQEAYLQ
jgi:GTP-binding protein Era